MTDRRPTDPRMPVEAYLYTQGRTGRSVTLMSGPGIRLVRESDALRRLSQLRQALEQLERGEFADEQEARQIAAAALKEDDHQPQPEKDEKK